MNNRVVIIGHGYTSRLGIIRSLSGLDCEIFVIAMVSHNRIGRILRFEFGKPIDCYSKYVNRFFYCQDDDENGLINVLLNKCACLGRKVILIPDSDVAVTIIDKHQDRLLKSFVFPSINNEPEQIVYWMNKVIQKKHAECIGLNVANGCVVEVKNKCYTIPEEIKFPCFTKPIESTNGGKRFFRHCDNIKQLSLFLSFIAQRYNTQILVEDFKQIDKEYAIVGFSDDSSVVIPGIIEFKANSGSHYGVAREGIVRPVDGFEMVIEQFKELVTIIGYKGLFDIDFYESQGVLYFGEINFRFGGSGYAITSMGANLPEMMVKGILGQSYDNMPSVIKGTASFINERMCLDDYVLGYLNENEFKGLIESGSIHFIFDENDPGPQRGFNRYCHFQRINKTIRSIRKSLRK